MQNGSKLQTIQNTMLRTVFGYRKEQHVNMEHVRKKFKIMSVNQMAVYHTLLEAHNVVNNWNEMGHWIGKEVCSQKYK